MSPEEHGDHAPSRGPRRSGEPDPQRASYRVSGYTIYPSGYDRVAAPARENWRIMVVDADDGWSIRWKSRCLNYRGVWEFEPPRQSRTPDFLARCRFTEHAALHRARTAVDRLTVDGMTYDEFVDWVRADAMRKARVELKKKKRSLLSLLQRTE
jgi:hypothetical protein